MSTVDSIFYVVFRINIIKSDKSSRNQELEGPISTGFEEFYNFDSKQGIKK